jgi:hypothetical protein
MHAIAFSISVALLLIGAVAMTQSIAFADDTRPAATQPSPSPDLAPKEVVKTILDALEKNNANDSGIKTAWKFASPANQKATGPLQRFIPMVKNPAYGALLNHKSAKIREIAVKDDQAAELVTLTDSAGNSAYFVFQLSKQTDAACKDCWMTDGVFRVEPPDGKAKPAPAPPDDGALPA